MSFRTIEHEGKHVRVAVVRVPKGVWIGYPGGARFYPSESAATASSAVAGNAVVAPMTAKVVQVRVAPDADVVSGELLVVLEAMKMEYRLVAPRAGKVAKVSCHEGELVDLGSVLVELA